ncbi:hypothetical protein [uncultured Brevundimonas sp.]|uniref:hypothetical protein n=1 Tax=uncultured Brevundimonas sp. TaxID=213418 RepID=UPI00261A21EE|nr:hypothetical protein [uncultured Brevundimonas sp.]
MTEVEPITVARPWHIRMALLHPAWLLLATMLMFLGQLAVLDPTPTGIILAGVCTVAMVWFLLGWTYGIYRVARDVSEQAGIERGPDRGWVVGMSAVAILVLPIALVDLPPVLEGLRDLVGGVGALSFFASFWLAAAALVTAEGHPVRYPTNRAVGAFLLIVYSFIGAWFLRPRILALLDAPRPPEEVRLD